MDKYKTVVFITIAEVLCGSYCVVEVKNTASSSSLLSVCSVGGVVGDLDLGIRHVVLQPCFRDCHS